MAIPWTVLYQADDYIAIAEVSAPHDALVAKEYMRKEYGLDAVALIPGCHMDKTFLFSKKYKDALHPFLHIDGKQTSAV